MAETERVGRGRASPLLIFLLGALIGAIAVVGYFVIFKAEGQDAAVSSVSLDPPRLSDVNMPDQPKLPKGL